MSYLSSVPRSLGPPTLVPILKCQEEHLWKGSQGPAVEGSHSEGDRAAELIRWPWELELLPRGLRLQGVGAG